MDSPYWQDDSRIFKNGKEGPTQLTNFVPRIKKQLVYHDGKKHTTHLVMDGRLHDPAVDDAGERKHPEGRPLPETTIPATAFSGLDWVAERWGMAPVVFPVPGAERELRTAIQTTSTPETEHIYTHTGWTVLKGKPVYLSKSGGISDKGLDRSITVELPHELRHYSLPEPSESRDAFLASLRLINLGPAETTWPLLLATYRAAIGGSDFGMHVAGRTGTFKSELVSLMQSHYGEGMNARNLPASWNSTANAVEALAYYAKDAIMVLDDFVPVGTAYHVRNMQKMADQIFRGQGNQAGRSRLTDVSSMQTTMYPRGMVLSTGEDVPEGHSVRARMLIMELTPGCIAKEKLSNAQQQRHLYPLAMADWIKWLATTNAGERLKTRSREIRDAHLEVGHSRTPPILGDLIATLELICMHARDMGWLATEQLAEIANKGEEAVLTAGANQLEFQEASDPVKALLDTLRQLMATHHAHAKTTDGGTPRDYEKFGWTAEGTTGGMPGYKSHGPRIGWVNYGDGLFYLDPNALQLIKKNGGGKLAVTKETLLKRMKESGTLAQVDDSRQRNTVRVMLEKHRRQVLALTLQDVLDESDD